MSKITANKTERRDWVVNKNDMVPTRSKPGKCRVCKKVLSIYNLDKYCHCHKLVKRELEDMSYLERARKMADYYREQNKKYYRRKKSEAK